MQAVVYALPGPFRESQSRCHIVQGPITIGVNQPEEGFDFLRRSYTQGLVNVPIEHHPTIGDIISKRYLKVMFKIPKKGYLPTPDTRKGLSGMGDHLQDVSADVQLTSGRVTANSI